MSQAKRGIDRLLCNVHNTVKSRYIKFYKNLFPVRRWTDVMVTVWVFPLLLTYSVLYPEYTL